MISRFGVRGFAAALFFFLLSAAAMAQVQAPAPAGMARVWFLRVLEPGTAMNAPRLFANGQLVGIAAQGAAFYRDFPAGTYRFAAENCVPEPGSAYSVTLPPGMVIGLNVTVATGYAPLGCSPRDVYYVRPVPPQLLPSYLAGLSNLGPR